MAAKERLDVLECEPEDELYAHRDVLNQPQQPPPDDLPQDPEVK